MRIKSSVATKLICCILYAKKIMKMNAAFSYVSYILFSSFSVMIINIFCADNWFLRKQLLFAVFILEWVVLCMPILQTCDVMLLGGRFHAVDKVKMYRYFVNWLRITRRAHVNVELVLSAYANLPHLWTCWRWHFHDRMMILLKCPSVLEGFCSLKKEN